MIPQGKIDALSSRFIAGVKGTVIPIVYELLLQVEIPERRIDK